MCFLFIFSAISVELQAQLFTNLERGGRKRKELLNEEINCPFVYKSSVHTIASGDEEGN